MDATHYFAGGVLCGAQSSRLALHRGGVTCPACVALLSARVPPGPMTSRVLDRYAALCMEEESSSSDEWSMLSLRAARRGRGQAMLAWMKRLLDHAHR